MNDKILTQLKQNCTPQDKADVKLLTITTKSWTKKDIKIEEKKKTAELVA